MFAYAEVPQDWFTIAKSDSTEMPNNFVGLYVGGTGDVNVLMHSGNQVLFKAVPVGTYIPGKFRRIMSTSTTATLMLGARGQGK